MIAVDRAGHAKALKDLGATRDEIAEALRYYELSLFDVLTSLQADVQRAVDALDPHRPATNGPEC